MRVLPESYRISAEEFTFQHGPDGEHEATCTIGFVVDAFTPTPPVVLVGVPAGASADDGGGVVYTSEVDLMIDLGDRIDDATYSWAGAVLRDGLCVLCVEGASASQRRLAFRYTAPGPIFVPLGKPYPEVPSRTTLMVIGNHRGFPPHIEPNTPSTTFSRFNRPQVDLREGPPPPPPRQPRTCTVQ